MKKIIEYNNWARDQGYDSRQGINFYTDQTPSELGYFNLNTMDDSSDTSYDQYYDDGDDDDENTNITSAKKAAPATWGIINTDFKSKDLIYRLHMVI